MIEELNVPEICGCKESNYLQIVASSLLAAYTKVLDSHQNFVNTCDTLMSNLLEVLNYDSYASALSEANAVQSDNTGVDSAS